MSLQLSELRERKERLAAAILEKRRREERARQSDLGERGRFGGLIRFIEHFWHILEPNTPLVIDMQMEAICLHLEAVTRGEIKRLCINVSPGAAKSLIVNVYWPLWEWSAAGQPNQRYVTFAYAAHLTERDNARFRDVIQSRDFQEMWGHTFKLVEDGKIKPVNDKTGWKFSSSVRGVGTGERGNRILCFPADQKVATEFGVICIKDIVDRRLPIRAWSFNLTTNALELHPIVGWHRNPGRPLVKVTTASGASVTCTHDHKIYTADGTAEASLLRVGDKLLRAPTLSPVWRWLQPKTFPTAPTPYGSDGAWLHTKFFCQVRAALSISRIYLANAILCKGKLASVYGWRQCQIQPSPLPSGTNGVDRREARTELCRQRGKSFWRIIQAHLRCYLAHHLFSKMGRAIAPSAVALTISNVIGASSVLKVTKHCIGRIAILMTNLLSFGARAYKCFHNQPVHHSVDAFAVYPQCYSWVSDRKSARHDLASQFHRVVTAGETRAVSIVAKATRALDGSWQASHSTKTRNLIEGLGANHWQPTLDCITSVDFLHEIPPATYCVTVAGNGNLFCGHDAQLLTKNCDDLHSVKEGESEAVRSETVRWAREAMSNRLNDMQEDVIVLIGQRVHDEDVSAALLGDDLGYVHLSIPMEYDPTRHCATEWWEDPRTEPGELASPKRFPAHVIGQIKRTLGPYAWSAQYQQAPEPRGGGILKRDWWGTYVLPVGAPFRHNFEFIIASLDPAYTAKQENDPSGFTVWGVYYENGDAHIVLLHAWKKWLELHGQTMERLPNEDNRSYVRRASPHWGLVEWVAHDCRRLRVHRLLVEDKASGHSVAQEIRRLYGGEDWGVQLVNPGAMDKRARAYAVQHLFADGMIEAPASESGDLLVFRDWAQMVIDECAKFRGLPGDEDNLVDSAVQAIKFLRDSGMATRKDERRLLDDSRARKNIGAKRTPIYPV